jgi:hypothetical protein
MFKVISLIVLVEIVSVNLVMAADKSASSTKQVPTTKSESSATYVEDNGSDSNAKANLAMTKPEKVTRTKKYNLGRHGTTAMARERILQPEAESKSQN